jgi:transposase-like protein
MMTDRSKHNTGPRALKYQAKIQTLIQLLSEGHSVNSAADQAQLVRQTIYDWRDRFEWFDTLIIDAITTSPRLDVCAHNLRHGQTPTGGRITEIQNDLVSLLNEGDTIRQACEKLSISTSTFYQWKKRYQHFYARVKDTHSFTKSGHAKSLFPRPTTDSYQIVDLGLQGSAHLYFIDAIGSNLIKIGVSKKPESRLKGLRTGSPLPLELQTVVLCASDFEKSLHKHLESLNYHSHGEWFFKHSIDAALGYLHKQTQHLVNKDQAGSADQSHKAD